MAKSKTKKKSIGARLQADPYANANPYAFKEDENLPPSERMRGFIPPDDDYPEGQILRWVNPVIREKRGLRGHIMMEWSDPYIAGKDIAETRANLAKYLPDPPDKFAHSDDNFVTRGDSILARLDKAIFDSRQLQRQVKADANMRAAAAAEHAGLEGEGLTDDKPTRRDLRAG
jgi:hypothetical protein